MLEFAAQIRNYFISGLGQLYVYSNWYFVQVTVLPKLITMLLV